MHSPSLPTDTAGPPPSPQSGQATANGFGLVNQEAVFRVCDQPHPLLVSSIVQHCLAARLDEAYQGMKVGQRSRGVSL